MRDAVHVEGLGKTYRLGLRRRRLVALEALDLRVAEGSVFGFVGPNGAGKSTTIKILVGLVKPTTGEATIFGERVPETGSRRAVGYLPENPSFHDFLRPLEVLSLMGHLSGMRGPPLRRRCEEVLSLVGLGQAVDLTVRKFSKGMVQRLGLAQAVLHDPPLLILDLGRRGKTIFFSTHILADVESICDRAGMLLHGRLVRHGTLSELLDGSIRSVELRCSGLSDAAATGLSQLARASALGPDGWTFSFPDQATANEAVARVVAAGGRVASLVPQRENLEQSFVRLAKEEPSPPRAMAV